MPVTGWIDIDETYCKGCELCIEVCPKDVLELDTEHLTPKGYNYVTLISDKCTGCAVCALICPEAAITVYREIPTRRAVVKAAA
jgi:2-oxoglutarate ferredoxin oxidoreductase subunit delta